MDILIVGETAREHALAWKFAESRKMGNLYCTSPYSGVDTLCERITAPLEIWRGSHHVDFTVGDTDQCLYRTAYTCPAGAVHVIVDCFTDGHTMIPMPAVRVYGNEEDGLYAAEAPAREYTRDIAHRAYYRHFVPHIRIHGRKTPGLSGVVRFEMAIYEDEPELLSVSLGFGEMDALALLPILRGELAGPLTACSDGTLTRELVRFSEQSSAVLMLGAERPGVHIQGLADVPKSVGVFMGAVQFTNGKLLTAGRRALFVCGRGQDRYAAARAARTGIGKLTFDGAIRYHIGR